jgi:hypothetical protein
MQCDNNANVVFPVNTNWNPSSPSFLNDHMILQMSEVDNASCTLNGDLKTHLLSPAECLVQELDRASNKRSRRVVAAGNPPSNRDSHRVQST